MANIEKEKVHHYTPTIHGAGVSIVDKRFSAIYTKRNTISQKSASITNHFSKA
jgi:hypothetical protein